MVTLEDRIKVYILMIVGIKSSGVVINVLFYIIKYFVQILLMLLGSFNYRNFISYTSEFLN